MIPAPHLDQPVFNTTERWALRVLAWLAFGASAYLAWHSVLETSVAGCGMGGHNGCDGVLASRWSKWLGLPVAVVGLACYATIATLSIFLGVPNARVGRWINTAFVMLALAAAGASAWFIGLQVVAIGDFCKFCIATDVFGIALGAVAAWSAGRWLRDTRHLRHTQRAASGLMALRTATALPAGGQRAATPVARELPTPSLPLAVAGASAIVALLVAGQVLVPTKTYELRQVALDDAFTMDAAAPAAPGSAGGLEDTPAFNPPAEQETHVALRPATEPGDDDEEDATDSLADSTLDSATDADDDIFALFGADDGDDGAIERNVRGDDANSPPPSNEVEPVAADSVAAESVATEPPDDFSLPAALPQERIVKLLGGKLTLDVYKHPVIGSPDAPHIVVELVSYNCKHCRTMHKLMKQAQARYGDQVAVVVMVIPMERACNKLVTSAAGSHPGACATARMALGLARLRPSAFAQFHEWLMADKDRPPPTDRVVARAYSLVDRDRLRETTGSQELIKQLDQYINLYAMLRSQNTGKKDFGLPVQILGDHILSGSVEKPEDLYRAWEQHLGVKPR